MRKLFNKRFFVVFVSAIFIVLASVGLIFLVQLQNGAGWESIGYLFGQRLRIMIFTVLLLTCFFGAISALTKAPVIVTGVTYAVMVGFNFVSKVKLDYRGMWLLPEDLRLAREADALMNMVDTGKLITTVVTMLIVVAVSIVAHILVKKWLKKYLLREKPLPKRTSWAIRCSGAAILFVTMILLGSMIYNPAFSSSRKGWTENLFSIQIIEWNQLECYWRNGIIVGFLYNARTRTVAEPEGYSQEALEAVAAKYNLIAEAGNKYRRDLAKEDVDILFVMNESFYDPEIVREQYPYSGGDITPNLRRLQQEAISLTVYSPEYGGGTANVEFEALTGLTNYFYGGMPYQDVVARISNFTSLARILKPMGYETIGMHPYNGTFYKRDFAYKNMGFDRFIDENGFTHTDTVGNSNYISDRAAYDEVLDILSSGGGKKFINLVTMQNHMPWGSIFDNHEFVSSAGTEYDEELTDYYSLLHESDAALGYLIERLSSFDRNVIVVFWGDHAPGRHGSFEDANSKDTSHYTPMIIWQNFKFRDDQKSLKFPEIVTPNQIPNLLFNALYAKKPTMFYLLDALLDETPILARVYSTTKEIELTDALRDYEFINYSYYRGALD